MQLLLLLFALPLQLTLLWLLFAACSFACCMLLEAAPAVVSETGCCDRLQRPVELQSIKNKNNSKPKR
jgi:hypothetical protein